MEFDAFELTVKGKQLCICNQVELGIKCFETALVKGISDVSLVMAIHNELGNAYFSIKDYENALINYSKNLNLSKSNDDFVTESMTNGNISSVLKMLGKFDEAIIHCDYQLNASRNLNCKPEIAKALYNMGNIYYDNAKACGAITRHDIGQFPPNIEDLLEKAAACYKEALKINKKVHDNNLQSKILGNYANIHYLLNNYKKSLKLNSEKLKIVQKLGDKESERRTYVNRGNVNAIIKNYESAIQDYKCALNIAKSLKDIPNELKMLYTIANAHYISKQYDGAVESMLEYLSIIKNTNNKASEARVNQCLSLVYAEMGEYKISKIYSKQYEDLSKELGDETECSIAQENLHQIDDMIKYIDNENLPLNLKSKSELIMLPMKNSDMNNFQSMNLPNFIHTNDLFNMTDNGLNKVNTNTPKVIDDSTDEFFQLLSKYQMQKLKEQSMNFDHKVLEEQFNNYISSSKKIFLDALVNSQSRRMDDQRADLPIFIKKM